MPVKRGRSLDSFGQLFGVFSVGGRSTEGYRLGVTISISSVGWEFLRVLLNPVSISDTEANLLILRMAQGSTFSESDTQFSWLWMLQNVYSISETYSYGDLLGVTQPGITISESDVGELTHWYSYFLGENVSELGSSFQRILFLEGSTESETVSTMILGMMLSPTISELESLAQFMGIGIHDLIELSLVLIRAMQLDMSLVQEMTLDEILFREMDLATTITGDMELGVTVTTIMDLESDL